MKRYAPPPPDMQAPDGTKVAYVYYFNRKGEPVSESAKASRIEMVFWADDDETDYVGSRHAEKVI